MIQLDFERRLMFSFKARWFGVPISGRSDSEGFCR